MIYLLTNLVSNFIFVNYFLQRFLKKMGNCNCGRSQKSWKKDATILTEEEIRLLLSNTKLNREQINALHNNFLEECPNVIAYENI